MLLSISFYLRMEIVEENTVCEKRLEIDDNSMITEIKTNSKDKVKDDLQSITVGVPLVQKDGVDDAITTLTESFA